MGGACTKGAVVPQLPSSQTCEHSKDGCCDACVLEAAASHMAASDNGWAASRLEAMAAENRKGPPPAPAPKLMPAPVPMPGAAAEEEAAGTRRCGQPLLSRRRAASVSDEEETRRQAGIAAASHRLREESARADRLASNLPGGGGGGGGAAVAQPPAAGEHPAAVPPPVVMVIERAKMTRKLIERMLTNEGVEPVVVEDCWSAKELLVADESATDVVLCDSALTDSNGVPMWSWILSHPSTRTVPVILMSARQIPQRQLRAMMSRGVAALVGKPVTAAELLSAVHGASKAARTARLAAISAAGAATAVAVDSDADEDGGKSKGSSGRSRQFESGLTQARRELQHAVQSVPGLAAAVEAAAAEGGVEGDAYARAVHKMAQLQHELVNVLERLGDRNLHQPGFVRNVRSSASSVSAASSSSASSLSVRSLRSSGGSSGGGGGGGGSGGGRGGNEGMQGAGSGRSSRSPILGGASKTLGPDTDTKRWLVQNFTEQAHGAGYSARSSNSRRGGDPASGGPHPPMSPNRPPALCGLFPPMAGGPAGELAAQLSRWNYNIFEACEDEQLLRRVNAIFVHLGLLERYAIEHDTWTAFLLEVRAHYMDNPYHSFAHACDVAISCFSLLTSMNASTYMSTDAVMSLLVGALCHDLEHPGRNNRFLIDTEDEIALRYNDRSVLENHHCFVATQILRRPTTAIFANATSRVQTDMRSRIVSTILATDMAHHFEFSSAFQQRLESGGPVERSCEADCAMVSQLLIKAADISNVTKPWVVAKQWCERITVEFFAQGDESKELGLPLEKFMDRSQSTMEGNTLNFIRFVVRPLYRLVSQFLPAAQVALDNMNANEDLLKSIVDEQTRCRRLEQAATPTLKAPPPRRATAPAEAPPDGEKAS